MTMVFHAIFKYSHELDQKLLTDSLDANSIREFLNMLIEQIPFIRQPYELGCLLTMHRKWKELLFRLWGEIYAVKLQTISVRRIESPVRRLVDSLQPVSIVARLEGIAPRAKELIKISRAIDPYKEYEEALTHLEPDFMERHKQLLKLHEATEAFRIADLAKTITLLKRVLITFRDRRRLEGVDMFLYAWALHAMGNVHFVVDDMITAGKLFQASYHIKREIPELPRVLLYNTQLKLVATRLFEGNISVLERSIQSIADLIEEDASILLRENRNMYQNLQSNVWIQCGISHTYRGSEDQARKYFEKAFNLSKQYGDYITALYAYIRKATLTRTSERMKSTIHQLITSLGNNRLSDPYIRRMAGRIHISELKILNWRFANIVRDLFSEFGILPLESIEKKTVE